MKPNEVNKYFSSMGSKVKVNPEKVTFYNNNINLNVKNEFKLKPVHVNEVKAVMYSITSKAVGNDSISIEMVKMLSPYCVDAITHLVNTSLLTEEYATNWKEAILLPYPKVKKSYLYIRTASHFNSSCFIKNIRENSMQTTKRIP